MNNRIAIFTNGFSNEFVEHIVTGIQRKAQEDSIDLFVFVTYCSPGDHELQNKCQLNIFHLPDPAAFDGAIMLTNTYNFPDEQERVCARFQRSGVPMLSLEVEVPDMSCIKTENYNGVRELALHLVEHHNAKKIIYVNGVDSNVENLTRRQALVDVLNDHGLELYDEFHCDFGFYTSYTEMKQYLKDGKELPDAIVCANDNMALGINFALTEVGYSVPDDVLLTGFDMSRTDSTHSRSFLLFLEAGRPLEKKLTKSLSIRSQIRMKDLLKNIIPILFLRKVAAAPHLRKPLRTALMLSETLILKTFR